MTTAQHTPGPWYATTMGKAGWVDVFAHGVGIPIASTRHHDQEANTHLICAAPDMLSALEVTAGNLRSLMAATPGVITFAHWLDVVEQAIAAAKGGAA